MNFYPLRVSVAALTLLLCGCANSMLDGDQLYHVFWSADGVINVSFAKRPDGSYFVEARGAAEKSDQEIMEAWTKFVRMITRGRTYRGEATLEELEYEQRVSLLNAKPVHKRAKRASGVVTFQGEIKAPVRISRPT